MVSVMSVTWHNSRNCNVQTICTFLVVTHDSVFFVGIIRACINSLKYSRPNDRRSDVRI